MLRRNTCRLSHCSWTFFTTSWSSIIADDCPGVRTLSIKAQDLIPAGILAFSLTGTKQDSLGGSESPVFPCACVRIASVSTSTALLLSCWCSCWSKVAQEALENLAAPHRAGPGLGRCDPDPVQALRAPFAEGQASGQLSLHSCTHQAFKLSKRPCCSEQKLPEWRCTSSHLFYNTGANYSGHLNSL